MGLKRRLIACAFVLGALASPLGLTGCAGVDRLDPELVPTILPAVERYEAYVPSKAVDAAEASAFLAESAAFKAALATEAPLASLDALGEPVLKRHDLWVTEDPTLDDTDKRVFKRTTEYWRKYLRGN